MGKGIEGVVGEVANEVFTHACQVLQRVRTRDQHRKDNCTEKRFMRCHGLSGKGFEGSSHGHESITRTLSE